MTSIIGILCSDGVVIGCDSAATFGDGPRPIMEQPCNKLFLIDETVVIVGTGEVGMNQRFCDIAKKERHNPLTNIFSIGKMDTAKTLAGRFINDLRVSAGPMGKYAALVAWHNSQGFYLCEFGISDFQPEFRDSSIWYGSMGGAQHITDPFLAFIRRVFWKNSPPTVQQGAFAAAWALDHAIKINPGGVNDPKRIAVLEKGGDGNFHAREISEQEMAEHSQVAKDAEDYLSKFGKEFEPTDTTEPPPTA